MGCIFAGVVDYSPIRRQDRHYSYISWRSQAGVAMWMTGLPAAWVGGARGREQRPSASGIAIGFCLRRYRLS